MARRGCLNGVAWFVLALVLRCASLIIMSVSGALQIVTMAIIVHLHSTSAYPLFGEAKLSELFSFFLRFNRLMASGTSFYLSTISWSLDILIIAGLLFTALAAKSGKRWAAGRRAYQPIPG